MELDGNCALLIEETGKLSDKRCKPSCTFLFLHFPMTKPASQAPCNPSGRGCSGEVPDPGRAHPHCQQSTTLLLARVQLSCGIQLQGCLVQVLVLLVACCECKPWQIISPLKVSIQQAIRLKCLPLLCKVPCQTLFR